MLRHLRTLARMCIEGLATENGWLWAYGAGGPAFWAVNTMPGSPGADYSGGRSTASTCSPSSTSWDGGTAAPYKSRSA